MSDDPSMRDQVLAGVERNLQIIIKRHSAPRIDFSNMVDAAHSWGRGALAQLVKSAIDLAPGSEAAILLNEALELLNSGGLGSLAPQTNRTPGEKATSEVAHTVIILTALPVEYEAVRAHLEFITEVVHPMGTVYEKGIFRAGDANWEIILLPASMLNINTAFEVGRAIAYFRPQAVFSVGVAGGIKDVAVGDVVVATRIYGFESDKARNKFYPRPDVSNSSYALEKRARALARNIHWLAMVPKRAKEASTPSVFVGPIAAGEKVVASGAAIYRFIKATYSDALAVELEGRGLLAAIDANEQVKVLVVRGISNLVDVQTLPDRHDTQRIASEHASAFAYAVLAELQVGIETSGQHRKTIPDDSTDTVGANQSLPHADVLDKLPDDLPDIDATSSIPQIFVSYSHKDRRWLDDLEEFLWPLVNQGQFSLWSDTVISAGHEWLENIETALQRAKVAVLLVTQHFLASDFIMNVELPAILRAVEQGRLTLVWIAVSSSLYKETPLKTYQAANDPGRPLDRMKSADRNRVWVAISNKIAAAALVPPA